MAATMDAMTPIRGFTHITNNTPQWLSNLDHLTNQVAEQHNRFTQLTKCGEVRLTRKRRNGSTESLQPKDATTISNTHRNDSTALIPTQTCNPTNASQTSRPQNAASNTLIIQELRRKRKPSSDLSGAFSGHAHGRYRTKNLIVVYYDSAIQDAFEALVRNIATARNNLRKAQTDASFKSRMASMGMSEPLSPGETGGFAMLDPKKMRSSIARTRQGPDSGSGGKVYEEADKDLETAQSLCEGAAHQILRDGDCRDEIGKVRRRFENCLSIAEKEVEKLQAEEVIQKEKERQSRKSEERSQKSEESIPQSKEQRLLNAIQYAQKTVDHMEEKTQVQMIKLPPLKQMDFGGTGTIEVDDGSDAESLQIDFSAIRRTTRRV